MIKKQTKITVQGTEIAIYTIEQRDYISLTDIARYRNSDAPADVVKNWLRSRSTIEFLGLWERLNNPGFKLVEFDQFRNEAGSNYFVLSPKKWIDTINAIGITSKSGKYLPYSKRLATGIPLGKVSKVKSELKLIFSKDSYFKFIKTELISVKNNAVKETIT